MGVRELIDGLNGSTKNERLQNLRELKELYDEGYFVYPEDSGNVNNHIHTIYSFSPYSPTMAAYLAWTNGLVTAGIMDHDSVSGAEEFVEAGEILGIATTVGMECRVKFHNTPFEGKRINNPDQVSIAYVAIHGIPHQNLHIVEEFIAPYREKRNIRNRKMVENINHLVEPFGLSLDFEKDVCAISCCNEGGAITERHILFALSLKIIEKYGKGKSVVDFLTDKLCITLSDRQNSQLEDPHNRFYEYDLLGTLKSDMVEKFYIEATDECPELEEYIDVCRRSGAIPAYAYLGNIEYSVTGDKKPQRFEDEYFDDLVDYLKVVGFKAITYMPTRNTLQQLKKIMRLCSEKNFFQISGEDINSPRQAFKNPAVLSETFCHLVTSTWALIGHEKAATASIEDGMFTEKTEKAFPDLEDRVIEFSRIGKPHISEE